MKRVLIIEDIAEARALLENTVQQAFPGCVCNSFDNISDGLLAVAAHDFDLALLDIQLADGSGFEILKALMARRPETVCVITTILADDDTIMTAIAAGAQGYLLKEQPQQIQVRQLMQLQDGVPALSPHVARRILQHFHKPAETDSALAHNLTPREVEVLTHIAQGFRIREVAIKLELTENTVAGYVKTIYRKLNISSRAEAALCGEQLGLL